MKWKIVLIDVQTGESWDAGLRLRRKKAMTLVGKLNGESKGRSVVALPAHMSVVTNNEKE